MISLTLRPLLYAPYLPAWCAGVLAALGLFIGLLDGRTLFGASPNISALESRTVATQSRESATLPLTAPAIASLNLFGKVNTEPVIDLSTLPTTKLNWKLVGIIGSSFTGESRSLIAIDNNPTKAYFKGDTLPGGGVVYDIDNNYVIVQRGEQLEKLPLHAGNPGMSDLIRHSVPTKAVVEAPAHTEPVAATPVTPQTVYKDLEDRLASIRQKKSS